MATLKRNHHYVPQFWQRNFGGASGQPYAREGQSVRQASPKHLMSGDWVYTVFDNAWIASDAVEDALSRAESLGAAACHALITSTSAPDATLQQALREFVALQACRHPDILARGHRRSKELGKVLAEAHSVTEATFVAQLESFGVSAADAKANFTLLKTRTPSELKRELEELATLSPQDPQLPHTDALQAQSLIEAQLATMDVFVLDAAVPLDFVLGDTPVPQSDLGQGLVVPIGSMVALSFQPALGAPTCTRRPATATEVSMSNRWQFDHALKVIIGSNSGTLTAL